MANIFDGYQKLSDDDIRNQIAILSVVNIGNIFSVYGQKAHKGISKALNFFGGLVRKKIMEVPDVKEIDERIADYVDSLKYMSRDDLEQTLRKAFMTRIGDKAGMGIDYKEMQTCLREDMQQIEETAQDRREIRDECLSLNIVDKAAKYLGVDLSLTPAEKIEVVSQRYAERIYSELQKQAKKSVNDEARKLVKQLDTDIDALRPEEREAMRKALKLDEVTGETVRNLLVTTGGSTLFLSATTGFGSYIALTTMMHAVATTALGITLPFAAYTGAASIFGILTGPVGWLLLAGIGIWQFTTGSSKINGEILSQSVFLSKVGYKRSFMAEDNELPSWISPEEDPEAYEKWKKDEEEISRLIQKLKEKEAELCGEKEARDRSQKACEKAQERLREAEDRERAAEEKLKKLPGDVQNAREQLKHLESLLEEERNCVASTEQDKAQQQSKIKRLQEERAKIEKELKDLKDNYSAQEEIIKEAQISQGKNSEEIKRLKLENSQYKKRCEAAEKSRDEAKTIADKRIEKRADELEEHWNIYFSKNNRRIKVRKRFSRDMARVNNELELEAERKMKEIFDAKNPESVAYRDRGRMHNKENTLHCKVKYKYRLHYLWNRDSQTVEYVAFISHNEQDKLY